MLVRSFHSLSHPTASPYLQSSETPTSFAAAMGYIGAESELDNRLQWVGESRGIIQTLFTNQVPDTLPCMEIQHYQYTEYWYIKAMEEQ